MDQLLLGSVRGDPTDAFCQSSSTSLRLPPPQSLLDHIKGQLPKDTGHGFKVEAVEAREKDGGAFVRCSYIPDSAAPGQTDSSLSDIVGKVTNDFKAKALRPWYTWRTSRAHLVQGKPCEWGG